MKNKIYILLLILVITTSCTKKVWQCTTRIENCNVSMMHSEDIDKTGIDSFYDSKQNKYVHEYINCE